MLSLLLHRSFPAFFYPGLVSSLCLLTVLCGAADRVAFIVGVDRYDHLPADAQLRVAVSDARLMAQTLKAADPPFEVTLLEDQNRLELGRAFDTFIEEAKGAECALIYFAGHGVEYYGENFLLNRDTSITSVSNEVERMQRRLRNESLSLQAMVDDLDATRALVKVVIVDACRNNPLRSVDPEGTRSIVGSSGGLAPLAAPSGTLISYSADAGQKATDGLFTEVLTGNLATPGLTLMEVFARTRVEVRERSSELARKNLGVRHEPAEYVKINPAALKFTFVKGDSNSQASSVNQADVEGMQLEIVLLKKQLEEAKREAIAPSDPETANDEPTSSLVEAIEMRLAVIEAGKRIEMGASTRKSSDPNPSLGLSASMPIPGNQAGETRTFAGIEMVWCPPATFIIGSPTSEKDRGSDEVQHEVTLTQGFWIAKTECTQGQWTALMESNPSKIQRSSRLPVEYVSWMETQDWMEKMNQRHPLPDGWEWSLPREFQWEYACRAESVTAFFFGDSLDSGSANVRSEANKGQHLNRTAEVANYPPNRWGIYDMHGNVWEWCEDWFSDYPTGPVTDPATPAEGEFRIYRGGSWDGTAEYSRTANRAYMIPWGKTGSIGFRPVITRKQ